MQNIKASCDSLLEALNSWIRVLQEQGPNHIRVQEGAKMAAAALEGMKLDGAELLMSLALFLNFKLRELKIRLEERE